MSELRLRKAAGDAGSYETTQKSKKEVTQELEKMLEGLKPKPVPGTSNRAKAVKDQLQASPYDMKLIFELGQAYAEDNQWDRSANVLLRGFKRTTEIQDQETRFSFLIILCQASINLKKFRQALAVFNDMEKPEDEELGKAFELLKCRVLCYNGEMQKGLKAFNNVIEGADLSTAVRAWASCSEALRKADAWAVTKTTIMSFAKTDEEKQQVESMEKLADLKDAYLALDEKPKLEGAVKYVFYGMIAFMVLSFLWLLWWLESKSLAGMKMTK